MLPIWRKAYYRGYHYLMKPLVAVMPFPAPELLTGAGSVRKLPAAVKGRGLNNVLVVTDRGIRAAGLLDNLCSGFDGEGIAYTVYEDVEPNPSIQTVETGYELYVAKGCSAIVAIGGGSPLDCAKLIGARAVNPRRSVRAMQGMFKVRWKLPPFFAVPTTAGTGSETTVAAVITDPQKHEKFAVVDLRLIPSVAVLDPELMLGLPPHITAATGMDALTHAVEAYISLHATRFTDDNAEKAVRLIFGNLEDVYRDGSDLDKRDKMALAAFYGGSAFTRASVGNVHALAHNMGGLYGVPHGLANAIILPRVLEFCRHEAEGRLARLARAGGIADEGASDEVASHRLIEKIDAMNDHMGIPPVIRELREEDFPLIARRALAEANPAYPVPRIMDRDACEEILHRLLPARGQVASCDNSP